MFRTPRKLLQLTLHLWKHVQSSFAHTTTRHLYSDATLVGHLFQSIYPVHLSHNIWLHQPNWFLCRWWINCAEMSAVVMVCYLLIGKYGIWFDVVVKRESTFTHEVTSPGKTYYECLCPLCLLHRMVLQIYIKPNVAVMIFHSDYICIMTFIFIFWFSPKKVCKCQETPCRYCVTIFVLFLTV